ncbi:MAG: hypothetical protein WAV27_21470, partial [Xanthobacteraceae bacterium]
NSAGTSDMLMRNSNTGAFEVYDIANNQLTGAAPMGQIGLEWSVAGMATDPPSAAPASAQFVQAMATSASNDSAPALSTPAEQPTAQADSINLAALMTAPAP